jgi:enediyne polyketide synthase
MGVTPITPDQGVDFLRRLIATRLPHTSVVVTGRFGELPTLRVEPAELPLLRFLERPRVFFPGIELIVEADLSSHADPYVEDHVFAGEKLLPAVIGLEAMAQVAVAVTGRREVPTFEDVRFDRPVVIAGAASSTIRVAALVRGPDLVEVALRCKDTGYQVDHFRAVCRFGASSAPKEPSPAPRGTRDAHRVALDPERDLYGGLLFHRGRFRRVRGYRALSAAACTAEITANGGESWFGRYLPADLLLGDPAVRDGAIHAVQACIPHATILPVGVARLTLEPASPVGPRLVHAREVARDGDVLVYDLEVTDGDGTPCERWEGLRLKITGDAPAPVAWPLALLAPFVERRLRDLIPGAGIRVALECDADRERHARSDGAIGRLMGSPPAVRRRPDGKPEIEGGPAVSAAHAGDLTLAVAGHEPIGCDLEPVVPRDPASWSDLLGPEGTALAERIALETGEEYHAAATRVWAAAECLKKAGRPAGSPLVLASRAPGGWVLLGAGPLTVATFPAAVRGTEGPIMLAVLAGARSKTCGATSTGTSSASKTRTSSATSTT